MLLLRQSGFWDEEKRIHRLKHLAHRWSLLGMVDGGEGEGSHAAFDLMQRGGGVCSLRMICSGLGCLRYMWLFLAKSDR